MLIVAFMILSERFERPKPLRWRLRFLSKLMCIIAVQADIEIAAYTVITPSLAKSRVRHG